MHAGELQVGERLRTKTGPARIEAISHKEGTYRVYNFEVEETHAYYTSPSRVLSHNSVAMNCAPNTPTTITTGSGTGGNWTFTPGSPKPTLVIVSGRPSLQFGGYTVNPAAMDIHMTGTLAAGKSQWALSVDAYKATLDAAVLADKFGLWNAAGKASVKATGIVGAHGKSGEPTNVINVYRRGRVIHGCPGSP